MKRGEPIGRYTLESPLGRGGGGEVWRATDGKLGRSVAVKLLLHHDAEDVARFRREAELAASLKHPGIAALYEFGEAIHGPFIAMQLVEGVQLDKARLSIRESARAVRDAALAVQHAHAQGIVHRDLKPQNVMVSFDAGSSVATARPGQDAPWSVMVMDFGLAKRVASKSSLSVSGMAMGTPAYMSPEQAKGRIDVDGRTDVYGLGATLYALTTGRAPFNNPDVARLLAEISEQDPIRPRKLNPDVPPDLETVILKALEKDPARRYPTAGQMAEDLGRFLDGDPVDARPASMAYVAWKRVKKRPVTAAVVVAMSCLVLGFAALAVNRYFAALRAEEAARREAERASQSADGLRREMERRELRGRALDILAPARETLTAWEQARVRLSDEDATGVEAAIRASLETIPDFGPAWLERSRLKWVQGDLEAAEDAATKSMTDADTRGVGRFYRARYRLIRYVAYSARGQLVIHTAGARMETSGKRTEDAEQARLRAGVEEDLVGCARELSGGSGDPRVAYTAALLLFCRATTPDAHLQAAERIEEAVRSRRIPRWEGLYYSGLAYQDAGEFRQAARAFEALLNSGVRSAEVLNGAASALSAQIFKEAMPGDEADPMLQRAERYVTEVIEANPKAGVYRYNRALIRRLRGDVKGLREDVDAFVILDPTSPSGWSLRAMVRWEQGDKEGALKDFSEVVRLSPREPSAYSNRGQLRRRMGDLQGALEDFAKALEINPDDVGALVNRSAALRASGDREGAIRDATRAIAVDPRHPGAYLNRGNTRFDLKDYAGALSDWSTFVDLAPYDAMAPGVRRDIEHVRKLMEEDK